MADETVEKTQEFEGAVETPEDEGAKRTGAIGNLLLVVLSALEMMFASAILSDGNSLMMTKNERITIASAGPGVTFEMQDFTHAPYGIGAHHDTMGIPWDSRSDGSAETSTTHAQGGKNLAETLDTLAVRSYGSYSQVRDQIYSGLRTKMSEGHSQYNIQSFFDCTNMGGVGKMTAASVFLVAATAFVQIIVSGVNLSLQSANIKPVSIVFQVIIVIACIFAVGGSGALYAQTWDCENRLVHEVKMKTSFNMNWGMYLMWVVTVISLAGPILAAIMLYSPPVYVEDAPAALVNDDAGANAPDAGAGEGDKGE